MGTARITRRVAPAIHRVESAELVAIASRSREKAENWAATYDCPQIVDSYNALLERDDIDAVYIPLPPHLHAEWTIKAAQAGKHVLCEKPLGLTVDDVERMLTVCRNAKVCFDEGVMWYHHPRAAKMQSVIASGRLGQIRRVTSAFSFPWQSTVKPEDEYRLRAEDGGGSLMDLGWYCIGASLWVFGSLPESVLGRQTPAAPEADESFSGWLHFSEHQEAFFDCSRAMTSRRWIEIAGTEGSLVCDDFTRPWKEDKCRFWVHDAQGNAEVVESATDNQETCMIENFSRRVLSGEIDSEQGQRALQTQRVVEALRRSAQDQQLVRLHPQTR